MLEEEVREAEVAEQKPVVEEVKNEPAPGGEEGNKSTLITFILSVVGLAVGAGWFIGAIACIVLGAISLKRVKTDAPAKQPFITFKKVARPVGIVDIILGILSLIGWFIWLIVIIVAAIAAAAAEAGA